MATVTKQAAAPKAARATKQAPVAATPVAATPVAATPVAPPTVQVQAPAAVPAVATLVPAGHAGVAWGSLTKSQQAIAQARGGVHLAPTLAKAPALVLGQVAYKVRSGNNAFWWACCMQAMQGNGGNATAQAMVAAGACPKFVGYAVARGWLAPLPA